MAENILVHYGVKGMKWGVRRTETQLARARGQSKFKLPVKKTSKKSTSDDSNSKPKTKSIKDMSDDELRQKISRLNLEKQYRDLSKTEERSKSQKGKEFINRVLERAGEDIAVQLAREGMARAINKAFKEEIVFANNKKK